MSIGDIKKSRGRPRVGSTAIMVRVAPDRLAALDRWIAIQNDPNIGRPEAIRRLLDAALDAAGESV